MLSFEVRKPGGESEIRKVHRDVIHLGASSGNDLVVRARGVLGRHARISVVGEELRLDVLGTAPGSDVYLNGSIVKTAALASGDRIQIGEATITLLNGPAPNPNRISAPPPRGRDALSMAAAALAPPVPAPVAVPPSPRAPEPRPRTYEPMPAVRPVENRSSSLSAAQGFRLADVWAEVFGRLRSSSTLDERLQEVASYLSSSTPVHSVAFLSVAEASAGEAVAAIWKGTLPRLARRAVDEVFSAGGPTDVFEAGMRLRVYPVVRPGAEAVGLLVLPMELAADPLLNELAIALAAATGFVHAERADAPFGERGAAHAPAAVITAPLEDPATAVVGSSLAIQNLRVSLQRIASARAPVLIIGDVGSGKTLAAETLHALSPRRPRPLVRIAATASTAAALEEDLLGSPGPADRRRRPGRLFEADGGTLIIEEVSDLPAATQALLYRLLEAREVVAPGGRSVPLDVRVIGTSSRPLTRAVEEGTFRDDLYYRLSALTLRIPTLRDRKEDIPALLDAFAARHGGPPAASFDVEAMNALLDFNYAGNVPVSGTYVMTAEEALEAVTMIQPSLAIPMHVPLGVAVTELMVETGMFGFGHHHLGARRRNDRYGASSPGTLKSASEEPAPQRADTSTTAASHDAPSSQDPTTSPR